MKELIDKVSAHLNNKQTSTKAFFINKSYTSHDIVKDHFCQLPLEKDTLTTTFIDGGNAEILKRPELSLQLIKVSAVTYQNRKKLFSVTKQCYLLTHCTLIDNKMHYTSESFGDDLGIQSLDFDINDETLRDGVAHADISKISNAARRFAELNLAKDLTKDFPGSIIILDGTLQSTMTNESLHLQNLYTEAEKHNVIIGAVAKNTTIITDTGQNFSNLLLDLSPLKKWYYTNLVTINTPSHQAEILFTKLHEKSSFVFRTEIYNKQKQNIPQLITSLSFYSNDAAIPGYPYGLIIADQFARVTNQERDYYRTMLLTKLKKHHDTTLHQVLDTLQF